MIYSLIYVSRRTIEPERYDAEVARILEVSTARNASLDVTGALVCTPAQFSQILEGPQAAVEALMHSITADSRHTEVAVIETMSVPQRAFARWSMAHVGPSRELEQAIAQAADRFARGELAGDEGWRLRSLIGELAYKQVKAERDRDLT